MGACRSGEERQKVFLTAAHAAQLEFRARRQDHFSLRSGHRGTAGYNQRNEDLPLHEIAQKGRAMARLACGAHQTALKVVFGLEHGWPRWDERPGPDASASRRLGQRVLGLGEGPVEPERERLDI